MSEAPTTVVGLPCSRCGERVAVGLEHRTGTPFGGAWSGVCPRCSHDLRLKYLPPEPEEPAK